MNIFDTIRVYAGKWSVKSERPFSPEEIEAVHHAVVVDSTYGNSVCFFMKTGGMQFIPLSQDSTLGLGESVDVSTAKLITLEKSGESDIVRVHE